MKERPNRLLEFLTAPVKPTGEACRTNRRRASSARVVLSWIERGEWRSLRGRLRDISRAGAAVFTATPVPSNARARLRLAEGDSTPWIEVQILGVESERPRRHRVRMKFESPCPMFMLQDAILGHIEPGDEEGQAACQWIPWHSGIME